MLFHGRRAAAVGTLVLAVAVASAVQAQELAFRYDPTPHTFRVGVLLAPPAYDNPNAPIFVALQRSPWWPDGWELENPLAPAAVTTLVRDIWMDASGGYAAPHFRSRVSAASDSGANYWSLRGYADPASPPIPIPKDWPQYWEVDLSRIDPQQLSQFDLLYCASEAIFDNLSLEQHRGLISAVEDGTVLWVDNTRMAGGDIPVRLMPPRVELYRDGEPRNLDLDGWPYRFVTGSPGPFTRVRASQATMLLQAVFDLTAEEIAHVGEVPDPPSISGTNLPTADYVAAGSYSIIDQALRPVIRNDATGPSCVAAGRYGSGAVVATAGNVGRDCWEWMLAGWSKPAVPQHSADLKLAANILGYAREWHTPRQAPNGRAISGASVTGPLDVQWQFPGPNGETAPLPPDTPVGPSIAAPVVSNGMVYALTLRDMVGGASAARPYLFCFDARPERDLDGDGQPDDGLRDYADGTAYDMVWYADLSVAGPANATTRASSPAVVTLPVVDRSGVPHDVPMVLVTTVAATSDGASSGRLLAFNGLVDQDALARMNDPFDVPGKRIFSLTVPSYDFQFLTGRPIGSTDGSSVMVDLSTPVTHKTWAYFLSTEIDPTTLGSAPEDCTYGRAFCIGIAATGAIGIWVYPDAERGELQRALPPFQEPTWAADPDRREMPFAPGVMPVITSQVKRPDGRPLEAAILCGSPVRHRWVQEAGRVVQPEWAGVFGRGGGQEFCLVPTPRDPFSGRYLLNDGYYMARLSRGPSVPGAPLTVISPALRSQDITLTVEVNPTGAGPGGRYAWFNNINAVRECLTRTTAAGPEADPLNLQTGCELNVQYKRSAADIVTHTDRVRIPGPVLWKRDLQRNERRITSSATFRDTVISTSDLADYDGSTWSLPDMPGTAAVHLRNSWDGGGWYAWEPLTAAPWIRAGGAQYGPASLQTKSTAAPALMDDTAIAGMALYARTSSGPAMAEPTSAVYGLNLRPDLSVRLGPTLSDTVQIDRGVRPEVRIVETGTSGPDSMVVAHPSSYDVDYEKRIIRFRSQFARYVTLDPEVRTPIDGKAIRVTWRPSNSRNTISETHVVPATMRFAYIPGMIKLRYYPVQEGTVVIAMPNGVVVTGWEFGEPLVTYDGLTVAPNGWIDLSRAMIDSNGDGTPDTPVPGRHVMVSYRGFSEADGRMIIVPDPRLAMSVERHYVPILGVGPARTGVGVGHNSVIVGTSGALNPDMGDPYYISPDLGWHSADQTLLALKWDPVRNTVSGSLDRITAPLPPQGDLPAVAIPTGASAITPDGVFVGSERRWRGGPIWDRSTGRGGFVSGLRSARTIICDSSRIIETLGGQQVWMCNGTRVPTFGQTPPEGYVTRQFSRPAKAVWLPRYDTFLVVDTGNNRVVEVDRDGNQLWPLDENGNDYYSSPQNYNLRLSSPADVYRYTDAATGAMHTVIADTGNHRVVDLITWRRSGSLSQTHELRILTPSHAKFADNARPLRLRYVRAQPIWDTTPGLENRPVIGYLCAASNLDQVVIVEAGSKRINPPASAVAPVPGATMTWAPWAWLYADAAGNYDPLIFANIRQVEYFWQGSRIRVVVIASQYRGRQTGITSPTSAVIAEDGVFEWTIGVDLTTGAQGLMNGGGVDWMSFVYTASHYNYLPGPDGTYGAMPNAQGLYRTGDEVPRPMSTVYTPSGAAYPKSYYPVCAKPLQSGNYLITNFGGLIGHLKHTNLRVDEYSPPLSPATALHGEVFEATPDRTTPPGAEPWLDTFRVIPDPWADDWTQPLTQPTYAERY